MGGYDVKLSLLEAYGFITTGKLVAAFTKME